HLHSLRHTTATDLIKRGSELSNVKFILGHSSVKVTEGYTSRSISSNTRHKANTRLIVNAVMTDSLQLFHSTILNPIFT
ncbi:MAG: tyrosine-type recombinase/integrase, partial [Ignavibacteria bacterium]